MTTTPPIPSAGGVKKESSEVGDDRVQWTEEMDIRLFEGAMQALTGGRVGAPSYPSLTARPERIYSNQSMIADLQADLKSATGEEVSAAAIQNRIEEYVNVHLLGDWQVKHAARVLDPSKRRSAGSGAAPG